MAVATTLSVETKPTRARYWVIVSAVVLSVITYIHRVAISQAAPIITEDLGLSRVEMGWAFSALMRQPPAAYRRLFRGV